jgi:hypothetical protein
MRRVQIFGNYGNKSRVCADCAESGLNSGNGCYHWEQNPLSACKPKLKWHIFEHEAVLAMYTKLYLASLPTCLLLYHF